MALMFQRLAQNFIKKGFYPTDEETISGILRLLKAPRQGTLRLLDPCCGEGSALAEVAHYLQSDTSRCETYGVEIDDERAWHSKSLLDRVIHGDLEDCLIGKRQFSLMFFNPPYGDIQVYKAAVDQFKQIVIMGKRCRSGELETQAIKNMRDYLLMIGQSGLEPYPLPESDTFVNEDGDRERILPILGYRVPAVVDNRVNFQYVKMDPRQLQDEIARQGVLWERFDLQFRNIMVKKRQPLRKLTDWHMALMLAAGHVNGIVTSEDGSKTFVIKGDTHKKKDVKITHNENEDGSVSEVRTATDKFVPVIRAFDFTPGESYGSIVTIQ